MTDEDGKTGVRKRLSIVILAAGLVVLAVAAAALWRYVVVEEGPALVAQSGAPAGAPVRIDPGDPELVVLGRRIYVDYCATCHGADREGEPDWRKRKEDGTMPAPPHDESGHTWHHPDGMLFAITKSGSQIVAPAGYETGMPGFADSLSDREISASIAFIKSHWPPQIRRRQELITRQSR